MKPFSVRRRARAERTSGLRGRGRGTAAALGVGLVALASLFGSCTSARTDVGTVNESCYLALPTAAKAVSYQGHLAGVRKFALGSLETIAPRIYVHVKDELPRAQSVCLAAYTGHFTAAEVSKPFGRQVGTVAVAVVTTPGNELKGTLILTKVPVRFEHFF